MKKDIPMKALVAGTLVALNLATAEVSAEPTFQIKYQAGGSTLYFSNLFVSSMAGADVEASAKDPGKMVPNHDWLRIPVTGGVIDLDGTYGEIDLSGGLVLESGLGTLVLHNLTIEALGDDKLVTAVVEIDGVVSTRVALFEIDLEESEVGVDKNGKLVIRKLKLLLTEEGQALFSDVLGLEMLPGDKVAVMDAVGKLDGYTGKDNDDSDDDDSDDDDSDDDDSDDDSDDDDSDDDDSDDSDDDDSDDDDSDDDDSDDSDDDDSDDSDDD